MSGRTWRGLIAGLCAGLMAGCGGGETGETRARPPARGARASGFISWVSTPASHSSSALARREIAGVVVQNPFKMGELGVKTLVQHLEKQPVEAKVSTGEAMVTPENMNDPEIKPLLSPPKAENVTGSLSGAKTKKWRVMVIPKGTTHEFWMTIHAGALKAEQDLGNVEVVWQGPEKEDDRVQQIQLVQSAVAAGVDGIVLAPLDARALAQPVEMAVAKGIPVVIIDSGLDSTKPISTISTDNYHGGVLAARRMGQVLGGEGKVILLLLRGRFREHGAAREGVQGHPGQRVPGDLAPVGIGIRGADVGPGSAEVGEPGNPLPGAVRRRLLSQRDEHRGHETGSRSGRPAAGKSLT